MNRGPRIGLVTALLVGLLLAYGPVQIVHGANITINVTTTDDGDLYAVSSTQDSCNSVVPGHPCTLRGAMLEANSHSLDVVTIMVPSGVYSLTLGAGSASLTPGALYASANMTILGAGTNSTIIDGSAMVPIRDILFSFGNYSTINI